MRGRADEGVIRMDVQGFAWRPEGGWSQPFPTELDSDATLVVAFGAPALADAPSPLRKLRAAFPRARLVGCSTAGEILDDTLTDDGVVVTVARFARTRVETAIARVEGPSQSAAAGRHHRETLAAPALPAAFGLSER